MVRQHHLRPRFHTPRRPANDGHARGLGYHRLLVHQETTHGAGYADSPTESIDAVRMSVTAYVYDVLDHLLSRWPDLCCRESAGAGSEIEQRRRGISILSNRTVQIMMLDIC